MGTKLPSSNWSAEIFTKLFTSADAHTLIGSHGVSQSAQYSYGNLHGFILPFIHLLSPDSSLTFCSISPITRVRNPNPRKRTLAKAHNHIYTQTPTRLLLSFVSCPLLSTESKGQSGFFFNNILYECVPVCVYVCV